MTMSDRAMAWLDARGLDVELLDRLGWASSGSGSGEGIVIPFMRNGQAVSRKTRFLSPAEGRGNWRSDPLTLAWNEDCLRDEKLLDQPLIITEGQFDAATAIQCGFARAISVPHGAPAPKVGKTAADINDADRYAWLREAAPMIGKDRCPEIILATDGDGPGAQLLHDLSVILGRYRCKFLIYPKARKDRGRERCKDLNEVLEDYGAKGVVETIGRAQWMTVDGVFLMKDLPPLPDPVTYDIGFELLSENYKARLGDFVVITGVPGLGKSTFVNDLCCRLALGHKIRIGWASFEQAPQRDHRRALRSWYGVHDMLQPDIRQGCPEYRMSREDIADADEWIDTHHVFIVPSEDDDVTIDWMLDRMEAAVVRYGVKIMVIDPWNEMDHTRARDETMTEYVGRAIKALKRFARKFQIHLIVIAHPTKSLKDGDGKYKMPTLYDISDSANWYNKCDVGIVVHRETPETTTIKVQKSRYHEIIGRPGEVAMSYSKDERRFIETERLS